MEKRIFACALSLLLVITILGGCGKDYGGSANSGSSQTAPISQAKVEFGNNDLKMMTPPDVHDKSGFAAAEGVYQCLVYNGQYVLYYIDYATHQKVALCNRPECRHNDNTCAAWMPNHALPFVIGDKLYLWCMPEWTEDGPGPYFIQKRNLDGSEPEILWETDTGESIVTGLAANDEYFYFFTYQMSEGLEDVESATYWNRVKISDGSREKVKKLDPTMGGYDLVGAVGDKALLLGYGGESEDDRALFFLDPDTFEITPGFSYDGEKLYYEYLDGEKLYLIDLNENALKVVDLLTNEIKTVFPNLGLAEPQTAQIQAVIDDRYVALYSFEAADNYYGQIVYAYAVDLQQQTIQTLDFRYDIDHEVTNPYQVLKILPEGKLLIKIGQETAYYKMENFGLTQDVKFEFDKEAITTAEDFFSGTADFTPIEVHYPE